MCNSNSSRANFVFLFALSYSDYTIDALITLVGNGSFNYNIVINELYSLLLLALENVQTTISSIQRFGNVGNSISSN